MIRGGTESNRLCLPLISSATNENDPSNFCTQAFISSIFSILYMIILSTNKINLSHIFKHLLSKKKQKYSKYQKHTTEVL